MPKSRQPYPPEFREQMVELVRAGRTPEELSEEFEPSAQTIRNWVKQADVDQGVRSDGLTSSEREELRRLRREVKQLKVEREILKKAASLSPGLGHLADRCVLELRRVDPMARVSSSVGMVPRAISPA